MTNFSDPNRRQFVKASVGAAAALTLTKPATALPWASAATLRIGLIGCGGRGTGAVRDCLRGNDGVRLVAIGDIFADRVASCRENLAKVAAEDPAIAAKIAIDEDHAFVGFDAYQRVIDAGVDLVQHGNRRGLERGSIGFSILCKGWQRGRRRWRNLRRGGFIDLANGSAKLDESHHQERRKGNANERNPDPNFTRKFLLQCFVAFHLRIRSFWFAWPLVFRIRGFVGPPFSCNS